MATETLTSTISQTAPQRWRHFHLQNLRHTTWMSVDWAQSTSAPALPETAAVKAKAIAVRESGMLTALWLTFFSCKAMQLQWSLLNLTQKIFSKTQEWEPKSIPTYKGRCVCVCHVYLCIIHSVYSDYYVSLGCSNVLTGKMEVPEVSKCKKCRKKVNYSVLYVAWLH